MSAYAHSRIWAAIDAIAERHGLSPSGLARRAGLDPTAFNRSKRVSAQGDRLRWPSSESLARALEAVGEDWASFAMLTGTGRGQSRVVPLLGLAKAGQGGFFDADGFPIAGEAWDTVRFPNVGEDVYALEITGDSMEPVYRAGDRIIVQPGADVRAGDRVVVRTLAGEVMAKSLRRLSDKRVELVSFNPTYPDIQLDRSQIAWIARILWATQ